MGLFFSNIHVRRNDRASLETLREYYVDLLSKKGFRQVETEEASDVVLFLYGHGSEWISACGDMIDFESEDTIGPLLAELSDAFQTDALAIGCFDSDSLFLNLIDSAHRVDAWAKIGRFEGIKRRSNPSAWKGKVTDPEAFKAALKGEYTFTEEALEDLEPLLGMEKTQGMFCPELIGEAYKEHVTKIWFALPEGEEKLEPPRFEIVSYDLTPCRFDSDYNMVRVRNRGGKSTGLAVVFTGNYVEHDDITFRNVQLETGFNDIKKRISLPIALEKKQLKDDRWAYVGELPSFQIPASVKKGLPLMREMKEWYKKDFGIRFNPSGNLRKQLDICLHIVPLKNIDGQCCWCVWHFYGSKRAYIEQNNRTWAKLTPGQNQLDPNDFDDLD